MQRDSGNYLWGSRHLCFPPNSPLLLAWPYWGPETYLLRHHLLEMLQCKEVLYQECKDPWPEVWGLTALLSSYPFLLRAQSSHSPHSATALLGCHYFADTVPVSSLQRLITSMIPRAADCYCAARHWGELKAHYRICAWSPNVTDFIAEGIIWFREHGRFYCLDGRFTSAQYFKITG